ncbi:SH3 domain-containing protein [Pseudorhizobium flavum]|uniref:SH3 domain-containing protein n=1 Tax=Pseudorhizobium flavum TaxID=1335061 RepID=UPI00249071C2|nr:SH3 domain-containing protein [Pseudorhizobium flavum]
MISRRFTRHCAAGLVAVAALVAGLPPAIAADAGSGFRSGRETGYAVPRFVSLKAAKARMRIGPSTDYATSWLYTQRGLPLEITEEYGNWRRVRDFEGVSGWMSGALLSGDRTAIVGPWLDEPIPLRRSASSGASVRAQLSPRVLMQVKTCDGRWCEVSLPRNSVEGYVDQSSLWGVYPGERFK